VLAPLVYTGYSELPVSAVACILLALSLQYGGTAVHSRLAMAAVGVVALMLVFLPRVTRENIINSRNFYGTVSVTRGASPQGDARYLYHGGTLHGSEFFSGARKGAATTYYGEDSGIGILLGRSGRAPLKVGIVGLGAGTLAAYAQAGDLFRFYEINPLVHNIAVDQFTYLRGCRRTCEVAMGDARLSLESEETQGFDVLALDAFSSDSIPVHLLTTSAFRTYFRHLRLGGVLAVHISNRYLDLAPVVAAASEPMGKTVRVSVSSANEQHGTMTAVWAIVTDNSAKWNLTALREAGTPIRRILPWTDDYSNLFGILR
jgi:hypothetical protein